jgi:hypothetical protein
MRCGAQEARRAGGGAVKDDVKLATAFDAAVAGLLEDAPSSTEKFERAYNKYGVGTSAPVFAAIRAATNSDRAAREIAARKAIENPLGWRLWHEFLRVTGASDERADIAWELWHSAQAESGLMQGILEAGRGLNDAKILGPLTAITQSTGVVYRDGLAQGTGFLVWSDLFLTAAHVIAPALRNNVLDKDEAEKLLFKFPNNLIKQDGTWPRTARLAPVPHGLVGVSPPLGTPPVLLPDDHADARTRLDFALLRLDQPLGDDIGYVDVLDPPKPGKGDPLVVIGHPGGSNCKFDIRNVIELVEPACRVRHSVNTLEGMSGSSCADPQARVVALHEGMIKTNGQVVYNRAILLRDIRAAMKKDGIDPITDVLGELTHVFDEEARLNWLDYGTAYRAQGGPQWRDALAAFDPKIAAVAVTDYYHPIFGRTEFLDWIDRARPPASAGRVMLITGDDGCGKSFSTTILKARLRKSRDLVIPVTSEILRTADLHQIAEHIVKHGERELLKMGPGPVLRPAAASQRYDQHEALFDALRALAGPTNGIDRLLWLVFDVGRDGGWATANDALLKNLSTACAAHSWLRLLIVGISKSRANELEHLFAGVTVERDDVDMIQADGFKQHAKMLAAMYPDKIDNRKLNRLLSELWNEIEAKSRTDADRHLRCVEAVKLILQLRSELRQSREAAA